MKIEEISEDVLAIARELERLLRRGVSSTATLEIVVKPGPPGERAQIQGVHRRTFESVEDLSKRWSPGF